MSKILVVEDDLHTRDGLCELLSGEGYDVAYAGSVSAALKKLQSDTVLILSDLRLPDASGLKLWGQVRRLNPKLKSILMTAYASEETFREAESLGVYTCLTKPLDIDLLLRKVREVLAPPVAARDIN